MARTIWLLRHGDAEPDRGGDDFGRVLTGRGEREARAAGLVLAGLGARIETAWTSPRVRARDTARLACTALDAEPRIHEPLAGGFTERDLDELVAGSSADATLLLVGHEPDLSALVGARTGARAAMHTGGLAAISGGWLLALLGPGEIQLIAGV